MKIDIIVAHSNNNIIGNNNIIPWNYQEDTLYFKNITSTTVDKLKKNIIIMGYNTYESLKCKKLKNRINIIITSKTEIESEEENDLYFTDSLSSCIELCRTLYENNKIEKIFIIGGELIYKYYMESYYSKYLDKIYLTRIYKDFIGNKYFYKLEEKFYYLNIEKSKFHEELEYQIIQYDVDFEHPEYRYLREIFYLLDEPNKKYDEDLIDHIIYSNNFQLKIELNKYFPLFDFIKENNYDIFNMIYKLTQDNNIITLSNNIIEKNTNKIDLYDIDPYLSIYEYDIDYINNNINCNVKHKIGNMANQVFYNILFSSLLMLFIAKIMKLTPQILTYTCEQHYILKKDCTKFETIVRNNPIILPILNIKDKEYNNIKYIQFEDIEFLGISFKT